jgi:hypothetical protein
MTPNCQVLMQVWGHCYGEELFSFPEFRIVLDILSRSSNTLLSFSSPTNGTEPKPCDKSWIPVKQNYVPLSVWVT